MKNICVAGTGGVGGYFGGKIASKIHPAGCVDARVFFVARGKHLDEIRNNGLLLNAGDDRIIARPYMATDDIDLIDRPDICFLCVKSYDLDDVMAKLKHKIGGNTVIMPLLNGIDIYDRIKKIIPEAVVLPSCVYVGTHIEKPGVVSQKGGDGKILFGPDPEHRECGHEIMTDLFLKTGIKHEFFDDPYPAIWDKFIFISAFGLTGAYTGKTLGEMLDDPESLSLLNGIMTEIKLIAREKGIKLPDSVVEDGIARGEKFPYDTRTSYQRDVELKDKRDEGDLFGGTIIRLGGMYGIPTPVTERLYDKIIKKKMNG